MPEYSVSESNSAATTTVSGTVAPATGTFSVAGLARAGTSSSGVGQVIQGTYGTLVLNANGSFTYQLNNADTDTNLLGTGVTGPERFTYTYLLNGVTKTAALVFNVQGVDEPAQNRINLSAALWTTDLTIDALDQYWSTHHTGILLGRLNGPWGEAIKFENNGAFILRSTTDAYAVGFYERAFGPISVVNNGLIEAIGPGAMAFDNKSLGPVQNNGVLRAVATQAANPNQGLIAGDATGLSTYAHGETVINAGTIDARSDHGTAIGIWSRSLNTVIENSGFIYVSSGTTNVSLNIIGIKSGQSDGVLINNSGTIHVVSTAATALPTVGIYLFPDSSNPYQYGTIVNSGTIVATTAIKAIEGYLTGIHVTNSGRIEGELLFSHNLNIVSNTATGVWVGRLQFGVDHDVLINAGSIVGNVTLSGGEDYFDGRGGTVNGTVDGGAGRDFLYGGSLADQLIGGDGNDLIHGGGGADSLTGGLGADVFIYSAAADSTATVRDTINSFQSGSDKIDLSATGATSATRTTSGGFTIVSATTASGTISIRVQGTVAAADILTAAPGLIQNGGSGDDNLRAIAGNAELYGNDGNDLLYGSAGSNIIDGGPASDVMYGGAGDDVYYVDNDFDRVIELAGEGTDHVYASVHYTIAPFAENLTLLEAGDIAGLGNEFANIITGNSANNRLAGEGGNDIIYGAGGADELYGGNGADTFVYRHWTDTNIWTQEIVRDLKRGTDVVDLTAITITNFSFSHFVNYWTSSNWTTVLLETPDGTMSIRFDGIVDHSDFLTNFARIAGTPDADNLLSGQKGEWLDGGAGNDWLDGAGGSDSVHGGAGDDHLSGGTGEDVLTGGAGADRFHITGLTESADRFVDVSAEDFIYLDAAVFTVLAPGALSAAAFHIGTVTETAAHRILFDTYAGHLFYDKDGQGGLAPVMIAIIPAGTALTAANFFVDTSKPAGKTVDGSAANDVLFGESGDDMLLGHGGNDTLSGGAGNNSLNGGDGTDTADYGSATAGVTVSLALTGPQDTGGAGIDTLTAIERLEGSSHDDILTGDAGVNFFDLSNGGADQMWGGDSNDGFYFGTAFGLGDFADGGAGSDDQVALQGDYSDGVTLNAANFPGIETFALLPGNVTTYGHPGYYHYDYNITTTGSFGRNIIINCNQLRAGEDLTFNGSAETTGSFTFFGGFGTENLTGGSGNDGFYFGPAGRFSVGDMINGGGGSDNQFGLHGDYSINFNAAGFTNALSNIQTIALISDSNSGIFSQVGDGEFDYSIVLSNGQVAAGQQLTVTGTRLTSAEVMVVDGSAETDGTLRLLGGASADTLTGGAGADIIFGGLGADQLRGNGGADRFLYSDVAQSTAGTRDWIVDFEHLTDKLDIAAIDANALSAGNQAFDFIGAAAFSASGASSAGQLRAYQSDAAANIWQVAGDTNGDGTADFVVQVTVLASQALTSGDFLH